MPHRIARPVTGVVAIVLVLGLAGLAMWWFGRSDAGALVKAVATAPAGSERLSWTDWAGVRRELDSRAGPDSSRAEVAGFLDAAFDSDLSSRSALVLSAPALHELYGWSPATAEWELFSQSVEGAVVTVQLPDGTNFGDLEDRLEALGYPRPAEADGVWAGGPDLLPRLDATLTPELSYVALDADDRLVLASDQEDFLMDALASANDDAGAARGFDGVADALGDPLAAAVYAGDYACGALAMGQADEDDQAAAADLVAAAGEVDPYRTFAMGVRRGGGVRVVMEFADDDQARTNADSRAALASGPAVGQGGEFGDRFIVDAARADGSMVTLDLEPVEGQYVLSDLSSGPVLFATC